MKNEITEDDIFLTQGEVHKLIKIAISNTELENEKLKSINSELIEALEDLVGDCQNISGKIIEPSEHFLSKAKELINKAKQ